MTNQGWLNERIVLKGTSRSDFKFDTAAYPEDTRVIHDLTFPSSWRAIGAEWKCEEKQLILHQFCMDPTELPVLSTWAVPGSHTGKRAKDRIRQDEVEYPLHSDGS